MNDDALDLKIAAQVLEPGCDRNIVQRVAALIRAERGACAEIAARYGGRDAEAIAEQIGRRNFLKTK